MKRILALLAFVFALLLSAVPANAIVGGSNAYVNPGAVSLWTQTPNRNRCTGILVHPKWVLTAQHCNGALFAPTAGTIEARLGSTDNTTGYESIQVVDHVDYPGFDPATLTHDLTLLELKIPAKSKPAKLGSALPASGLAHPHGWGWTCNGPSGLDCSTWYKGPLQKMTAEKLPRTDCLTAVHTNHVCFEDYQDREIMSCLGDSGSGAFTKGIDGVWYVRFMVIADGDDWNGASCTEKPDGTNGYGLGVETAAYEPWVRAVTSGV